MRRIQTQIGPGVRLLAVVKAQGYGHGAIRVARAALTAGAFGLVVSTPEEADALGGLLPPERVLVVGGLAPSAALDAAHGGWSLALSSPDLLSTLERAVPRGERLALHLKVDTGMGRLGCSPQEAAEVAARVASSPHLRLGGIMTHFAAADADPAYTQAQIDAFDQVLHQVGERGLDPGLRHAANSAAALAYPSARYDAVRCGLALYGYGWPELRPALTLRALVVRVMRLPRGSSVGYGRTWVAPRDALVATLAIGYEDGVFRSRSNRGEVVLRDRRAPLVGAVSMDSITVDVTDVPGVVPGDVATIIGEGIDADEVGRWSNTIAYEVLTALGERVERRYLE